MTARDVVMAAAGATAVPGVYWGPRFYKSPLYTVAYSSSLSLFVAASTDGQFFSSSNGTSWSYLNTGQLYGQVYKIAWTGSEFIVACSGGVFGRSVNGVTWTKVTTSTSATLLGTTKSSSLFVAVGTGGAIVTSPDGTTWTTRTSGTTNGLQDVHWTGSQFVAVGAGGVILTSPDGITWTSRTSNVAGVLNACASSGAIIVACGNSGAITTSPDGITWTTRTSGSVTPLVDIIWTGAQFAICGASGNNVLTSSNGTTWSASAFADELYGLAFSGSTYAVVCLSGNIYSSTNFSSFTLRSSPPSRSIRSIVWSGSQYVAVGGDSSAGGIFTSPDGLTWTARTHPLATNIGFYGVAWSGSVFVVCGSGGKIITSPDGVTWTERTSGTLQLLWDVVWGGSQFVVVGFSGTVLTSPDGVTWTARSTGSSDSFLAVTWANNTYVIGSSSASVYTSPDGITWTSRTYGSASGINDIFFDGSNFIACGNNAQLRSSPDGVTWTALNPNILFVDFYEGVWSPTSNIRAVVATSGKIVISSNGTTWAEAASGVSGNSANLTAIACSNTEFVAGGDLGQIIVSQPPASRIV